MKFLVYKKASTKKNWPSFIKACQYDIIYEYVFHIFYNYICKNSWQSKKKSKKRTTLSIFGYHNAKKLIPLVIAMSPNFYL